MAFYSPAPDGSTCERFVIADRDVYLYRVHHIGGICEYEVTGQAWHAWMIAHRPEVEAIPHGGCMPLEMVSRMLADVGDLVRRVEPARTRLTTQQMAREMWESDVDVIYYVSKRGECAASYVDSPMSRRAFDVAWERDEPEGKRIFYTRIANRMKRANREFYR